MEFSGLQSSCEVRETVVRKGGTYPTLPCPGALQDESN